MRAQPLPRLPKLGGTGRRQPSLNLKLPRGLRTEKEVLPAVVPPFNSTWEVALNDFLLKQNPYWVAQSQFGRVGVSGATRPDWINDMLHVAFYLETPIHHVFNLENKDAYVRATVRALGYKVVEWYVPSFDYMMKNMHLFYRNQIEGLGNYFQ